jgi:hypothetical protein
MFSSKKVHDSVTFGMLFIYAIPRVIWSGQTHYEESRAHGTYLFHP